MLAMIMSTFLDIQFYCEHVGRSFISFHTGVCEVSDGLNPEQFSMSTTLLLAVALSSALEHKFTELNVGFLYKRHLGEPSFARSVLSSAV